MDTPGNDVSDPAVLWKWAEGFRPYLKEVVHRVLGDQLQDKVGSSDVVQQSLLAAAAKFDQFRGAGAMEFQAWLVAIARYEALDLLRYWHQDARNKAREQPLAAVSALGQQVADDSS